MKVNKRGERGSERKKEVNSSNSNISALFTSHSHIHTHTFLMFLSFQAICVRVCLYPCRTNTQMRLLVLLLVCLFLLLHCTADNSSDEFAQNVYNGLC